MGTKIVSLGTQLCPCGSDPLFFVLLCFCNMYSFEHCYMKSQSRNFLIPCHFILAGLCVGCNCISEEGWVPAKRSYRNAAGDGCQAKTCSFDFQTSVFRALPTSPTCYPIEALYHCRTSWQHIISQQQLLWAPLLQLFQQEVIWACLERDEKDRL